MPEPETIHQHPVRYLKPNRWGRKVNPALSPEDMESLHASIKADGIQIPLVAWKTKKGNIVVSGNTRLRIARFLAIKRVPVIFREFADVKAAKRFALIDNIARRQLTTVQRAEAGLELQKMLAVGAGRPRGNSSKTGEIDSWQEAAKLAGTSRGAMTQMKFVLANADPALLKKVRDGKVKLYSSWRMLKQDHALKNERNGNSTPKRKPVILDGPAFSCVQGDNADLIATAAKLYLRDGDKVADITYGRGRFWLKIDTGKYDFHPTDIETTSTKMDFKKLDYPDGSFDVIVFDPPYMVRVSPTHKLNGKYKLMNHRITHDGILAEYRAGMTEASRVLRDGGMLWVKCQDQDREMTHIDIHGIATGDIGLKVIDLLILRQPGTLVRGDTQSMARKNHSYLWIFGK